jgi:cupin fold WbuC family metalloprotein
MSPAPKIFDSAFLTSLASRAATSPRRRLNHNLHADNSYPCHRIFNAVQPDSWVQPHRHLDPSKDETVVVVKGRFGFAVFDDSGTPVLAQVLTPGMAIDIPHGTWHTCCALDPDSVFFETKAGPYTPLTPDERAPFAPPEGSPDVPSALSRLRSLFP